MINIIALYMWGVADIVLLSMILKKGMKLKGYKRLGYEVSRYKPLDLETE